MDKPFKFRRAREIAGAFVLLAAGLLVTGVVMHGQIRGWFQPKVTFEVALPKAGTQGVRPGSEVYILGNKAGTVKRIEMREDITPPAGTPDASADGNADAADASADGGEDTRIVYKDAPLNSYSDVPASEIVLVAILEVQGGMSKFVGSNSQAKLQRDLGGFGSSFIEITRDHKKWPDPEKRQLVLKTEPAVQDELTATVAQIKENITPALKAIADGANNISKFADKLQADDGNFQTTLASLNQLIVRIDSGEGALGVLLKDEQAKKDLSETLTNVKNTSKQLDKTITTLASAVDGMEQGEGVLGTLLKDVPAAENLAEALEGINKAATSLNTSLTAIEGGAKQFPATIGNVDDVVQEVGEAVLILQKALSDIQLVAEGLQGHWLVKGSIDDVKEDREKAEEAQRRAEAEAAARASGEAAPDAEKKRRGLFFWRK